MTPDDERLDQIRTWWKEYRWTVIGGTAAGVLAVGGWTGWSEYTNIQQEAASDLFQRLSVAVVQTDVETASEAFDELLADHSGTAYAERARLLLARAAFDAGNEADAQALLEAAISSSSDLSTVHVARIRLAQLLIAQSQYQQALDILDADDIDGYESYYQELRGDAYRAMNQFAEAKQAYEASIDSLGSNSSYRTILTLKLNDTLIAQ